MTVPEWQPIYGQCGRCQRSARLDVDLRVQPHLAGKIGVRCALCGEPGIYSFAPTAEGEIARQATHRPAALKAEAQRAQHFDEWQQFHAGQLGLLPQPKEGDEPAWQPDARTLAHWRYLMRAGRGPLDRSETEEEHDEQADED